MKKMNWKKSLTLTASAALALALLAGCGAQPAEQVSSENGAVGTVLLSVNPEIEVEYDKNGLVLEIEGLNEDGKTVVKDVKDYQGKDCRTVVSELVRDIYADGYFEGTVDGHVKNIVLKLEEGSVYVSDEFLQDVVDGIREAVSRRHRRVPPDGGNQRAEQYDALCISYRDQRGGIQRRCDRLGGDHECRHAVRGYFRLVSAGQRPGGPQS